MSKGGKYAGEADSVVRSTVEALGYDLVDTDFIREGQDQILRFYIDKRGGVGINDCEIVSRAVDPLLDEHFTYQKPYTLEVSSPGLTRPLKTAADYERYAGETVEVSLYQARDGEKQLEGKLLGAVEDGFVLRIGEDDIRLTTEEVAKIVRKIEFK